MIQYLGGIKMGKNNNTVVGYVSVSSANALFLNVREKPDYISGVRKKLREGSTVVVDTSDNSSGYFYKILKPVKGYVMRRYVKIDGREHTTNNQKNVGNNAQ